MRNVTMTRTVMHRWARTLVGLALIVSAGSGWAQTRASDALLALPETWEAHYNDGDVDALGSLYAQDATVLAPDLPPVHGPDAIASVARSYIDAGAIRIEVEAAEAFVTGPDAGWGVGTYELFSPEGDTVGAGSYLIVYGLVDGTWRTLRHMWNSDVPVAAP